MARGRSVAVVVAQRPLGATDFDPEQFARIVQQVVARHAEETASSPSGLEVVA